MRAYRLFFAIGAVAALLLYVLVLRGPAPGPAGSPTADGETGRPVRGGHLTATLRAEPRTLNRVVDAAYEKRSIALSSNLHPAGFDELMPKTIANATVDRLMHHAHVVLTAGDSIRLTQATAGKGVTPLTR